MVSIFHNPVTNRSYGLDSLRRGAPLVPEAPYGARERPKDRSMTKEQKEKMRKSKKGFTPRVSKEAQKRAAESRHLTNLIRGPRQYRKKNTQIL